MSKYRIAVASSDGIVVNQHFGRADTFYIFEADDSMNTTLVEKRQLTPVCKRGNHDDNALAKNVELLKDCEYILVSRIGAGAANAVESKGITPMELPGIIPESIEKLVQYIKIQELFP